MRIIKILIMLCMALYAVAFSVENKEGMEIAFPFSDFAIVIPVYLFFFMCLIIGALIAGFSGILRIIRSASKSRGLKRQIKAMEKEIEALKADRDIKKLERD